MSSSSAGSLSARPHNNDPNQSHSYLKAMKMMDCSLGLNTRMKYARQVKFFLHWIRDHEEERVSKLFIYEEGDTPLGVGGSVELPLPKNIILEFFGSKMIGDNNYENLLTSSTMGGYKSALVNWYKVNNMRI
mmetsp:Transcript_44054/g.56446  ORF Transcript_44054/g.56446 Transcript_44054/m.56446 type:complete len:132 (+) Transcript_44054:249-644(+)